MMPAGIEMAAGEMGIAVGFMERVTQPGTETVREAQAATEVQTVKNATAGGAGTQMRRLAQAETPAGKTVVAEV